MNTHVHNILNKTDSATGPRPPATPPTTGSPSHKLSPACFPAPVGPITALLGASSGARPELTEGTSRGLSSPACPSCSPAHKKKGHGDVLDA